MAKKLTDDKKNEITETGIRVFAELGYEKANTNVIAREAGISVGVLFKYYRDKESFFLACLERSIDILKGVLQTVLDAPGNSMTKAEQLFRAVIEFSRSHGDHIRMYQMITLGGNKSLTEKLASEIEGVSCAVYTEYIASAQKSGELRDDLSPEKAAFFFDNLLMTLQFTYSCDYYRQRLKMYTGLDADDESADEKMIEQLLLFTEGALGSQKERKQHGICNGI